MVCFTARDVVGGRKGLYTGDRVTRPDKITLKESFFGGQGCVNVEAKMVYDGRQGDILSQFVRLTKVFDEQRKIHDDPRLVRLGNP